MKRHLNPEFEAYSDDDDDRSTVCNIYNDECVLLFKAILGLPGHRNTWRGPDREMPTEPKQTSLSAYITSRDRQYLLLIILILGIDSVDKLFPDTPTGCTDLVVAYNNAIGDEKDNFKRGKLNDGTNTVKSKHALNIDLWSSVLISNGTRFKNDISQLVERLRSGQARVHVNLGYVYDPVVYTNQPPVVVLESILIKGSHLAPINRALHATGELGPIPTVMVASRAVARELAAISNATTKPSVLSINNNNNITKPSSALSINNALVAAFVAASSTKTSVSI